MGAVLRILLPVDRPFLEDVQRSIYPELLDQPCQDEHLCEVALHITDWPSLAPLLGMSSPEMEDIRGKWPNNVGAQRTELLRKWQEKLGRAGTYQRLCEAFYAAERRTLVEKVCEILRTTASNVPPPRGSLSAHHGRSLPLHHTVQEPSSPLSLPPEAKRRCVKGVSQPTPTSSELNYLRDMYGRIRPEFFLQWPPPPTRKFFNLAMIKSRDIQCGPVDEEQVRRLQRGEVSDFVKERSSVQLQDIFELDNDERKIILIEGAPGSGKSTLAWHACQKWKAGELFQEFKMVVFVQLRDPKVWSAKSIVDLLPAGTEKRRRDAAEEIEACEGRQVLFVLDGWDEYGPGLDTDTIVSKLICNAMLPFSSLIITSRPIASAVLQQRASSRVEIVGFTPEEIGQYFQEVLQDPVAVKYLQGHLKTNPVIEASCYLPLNAAIVVHLFLGLNHTLPRTVYGVFSAVVCGCIIRYLKKKSGKIPKIRSLDKLPPEVQAPFENVCVLAYEASMKNKATFSSEDLSSYGVSVEGNGLGLMQGVQSFLSGESDSYYFLHLSVQELLAAVHISKLQADKQVSIFRELFHEPRLVAVFRFFAALTKLKTEGIRKVVASVIVGSNPGTVSSLSEVRQCRFLAALTKLKTEGIRKVVASVIVGSNPSTVSSLSEVRQWRQSLLNILHCLYEAQDVSLCLFVASLLGDKIEGDLYNLSLSPLDCLCVGYFLHCVCVGREGEFAVDLRYCRLDSYNFHFLVKALGECSGVGVSRRSSNAVMGCLRLDLSSNSIDGSGVRLLCELMNNLSVIRKLDLSGNERIQDGEDGLLVLLRVLRSNHGLVEVRLGACDLRINDETGPLFVEMLHKNDSLKVLELSWNRGIGDVGVGFIAEGMVRNSGVVRLGLRRCGIGTEGGKVLCRMLTANTTLQSLSLWWNKELGDAGLMEVSKGMKVNCRLEELNIGLCGYSLDCLKEFVKMNSHLRRLGVGIEEVELLVEERAAVNELRRQHGEVEFEVVDGVLM